ADDGVMPQTVEHLAILELLGVQRGAVALTKIDRVDDARRKSAEAALGSALAGTVLDRAPVFAVNAAHPDDPGTSALRRHLEEAAALLPPRRADGLFRMAVDRVFTLAGRGTVVTGTVFSGCVEVGETMTVMPAGLPVRVRSLHAQNRPALRGCAGERCALNIVGADRHAIARGDWIADARLLVASERLDVRLRLLPGSDSRLAQGARIHVHLGTAHSVARADFLDANGLAAGASTRAQLVFDAPICALPGDRFIVRDARAVQTSGGGIVLDPAPPRRKRRVPARMRRLDALERWVAGEGIRPVLAEAPHGTALAELVRATGLPEERIELPPDAVVVGSGRERFALLAADWRALRERALAALRAFHAAVPDEPGPDPARLRRIAFPELAPAVWAALVDELVRTGEVARHGA